MSCELLTRDNPLLSRPSLREVEVPGRCAINRVDHLPANVAELIQESLSGNTRRAYLSDLAHFENWGGGVPSPPHTVASYLDGVTGQHRACLFRRGGRPSH